MTSTDDQLQFIDYRKPKLEAGDYRFTSRHQFGIGENKSTSIDELNVRVAGERVEINPVDIFACYPPVDESGDFSDTLAHISFKKGTLPWIRSAYKRDDDSTTYKGELYESWLYLMQLNDQDIVNKLASKICDCALSELDQGAFFPLEQKKSLLNDTSVNYLKSVKTVDIKKSLFVSLLLPNAKQTDKGKDQLESLAHIRRRWTPAGEPLTISKDDVCTLDNGEIAAAGTLNLPDTIKKVEVLAAGRSWLLPDSLNGDVLIDAIRIEENQVLVQKMTLKRELSVLMANRFGQGSKAKQAESLKNSAMVVSLEQYLNADVLEAIVALPSDAWIRLIVLTSWDFHSKPEKINFEERVKALDVNGLKVSDRDILQNPSLKSRLESGYVALEHEFRQGARSVSWYRGPFSPAPLNNIESVVLSHKEMGRDGDDYTASDADKLLHYYAEDGMLDISYSSAFEVGRLLGLKDKTFSKTLALYKRLQSRYIKLLLSDDERKKGVAHKGLDVNTLPYAKVNASDLKEKQTFITNWINQFSTLSSVPTRYLIPDEKLLSPRSLRLFHIDGKWLQCLMYGALSLHGRPKVTYELFHEVYKAIADNLPRQGAILRSDLVWAYPKILANFRNIQSSRTTEYLDLINLRTELSDEYTDHIESFPAINVQHKRLLDKDCLLYLTSKSFDYVSLALAPESLHYGADVTWSENTPVYKKAIKFRGQTLIEQFALPMTDKEKGIVNMQQIRLDLIREFKTAKNQLDKKQTTLVNKINEEKDETKKCALQKSKNALKKYIDSVEQYTKETSDFSSAKLGRFMLEGEPQAEFTVGVEINLEEVVS